MLLEFQQNQVTDVSLSRLLSMKQLKFQGLLLKLL
jgi:hypothetical protein